MTLSYDNSITNRNTFEPKIFFKLFGIQVYNAYVCILNWMNEYVKERILFILYERLEESFGLIKFDPFKLNWTNHIVSLPKKYIVPSFVHLCSYDSFILN